MLVRKNLRAGIWCCCFSSIYSNLFKEKEYKE